MTEYQQKKKGVELGHFEYRYKIRTAMIAGILFVLLSHRTAYKILDILIGVFTNKLNILADDDCNPHIIGNIIMSLIVTIIVFMV